MPKVITVILPILLALVGPLQAAMADGKLTEQEAVDLIQKIGPALLQAFPAEAKYIQLVEDVAAAVGKYLVTP